MNGVPDRFVAV